MLTSEQIIKHKHNPYRFFETNEHEHYLISFLKEQGLPLHWNKRELKLAWAFQGILGKPLNSFDKNAEYAVYEEKLYITQNNNLSLIESLIKYDKDSFDSKLVKGTSNEHFAVALIEGKYCTLSNTEKDLILSLGKTHYLKAISENVVIIDLQKAIELFGNYKASNFRIFAKIEKETSLFSALCTAFEIPESEEFYYNRNALISVFNNAGDLVSEANKVLNSWVEDYALKTHLSCFLEAPRGAKRRDIYLSSHYSKKWNETLLKHNKFPGLYLEALEAVDAICLLGWEWEYIDLTESRVLVKIK